jgi:hypothetical protein
MDYNTIDREPTITDIKERIAVLDADIIKLATIKPSENKWNIPSMTQATLLSKYNNRDYSSGPKGVKAVVDGNWWGFPGRGGWGTNHFPTDIAWWISGSDYNLVGTMGYFYYIYNSAEDKNIGIYWIADNDGVLKVNGEKVAGSNGSKGSVNVKAGKNVFEFQCTNSGGPGGFVFYAYEENTNNVLFKSGPGWVVSQTPAPDYTLITSNKEYLQKSDKDANDSIKEQINNIRILLKNISPKINENETKKVSKILPLKQKILELEATYKVLAEEAKIPSYFDHNVEVANIQARTNFTRYLWTFLYFIIFFIAFFIILKKPEPGNLDMFMLVFGVSILLYYTYNYYDMKQRAEGKPSWGNLAWFRPKWTKTILANTRWG